MYYLWAHSFVWFLVLVRGITLLVPRAGVGVVLVSAAAQLACCLSLGCATVYVPRYTRLPIFLGFLWSL